MPKSIRGMWGWYNSAIAQWNEIDPIQVQGGLSNFRDYVGNNWTNASDLSGTNAWRYNRWKGIITQIVYINFEFVPWNGSKWDAAREKPFISSFKSKVEAQWNEGHAVFVASDKDIIAGGNYREDPLGRAPELARDWRVPSNLMLINLVDTKVTVDAAREFQKEFPRCQIYYEE